MKVLGGDKPIVGNERRPREYFDFACPLVTVRTEQSLLDGTVLKRKTRVAADGRHDPRDIARAVELPELGLQRAIFVAGLAHPEIRISDVTAAYPHALVDPRYKVGVRMPARLPEKVRALGFEPGGY